MKRLQVLCLLFLFCNTISQAQLLSGNCEDGGSCTDNDMCTGTLSNPDYCENEKCYPGAAVCPFYIKSTTIKVNNVETGRLRVSNDDEWLYLAWDRAADFYPNQVFLFAGSDPLQSDDPTTFPFQFSLEQPDLVQVKISLEYLHFPTELDPIYLSMVLKNEAGANSWMNGYFTPTHHSHGGSYSYTHICNCVGYSHLESFFNWNVEIYTFTAAESLELPTIEIACANSSPVTSFFLVVILISVLLL